MHDPTTPNRQGNDVGSQYRSVIFFHSRKQQEAAKEVMAEMQETHFKDTPIVTQIVKAKEFFKAEEYHQKYLEKNPGGYCSHRLHW